MSDLMNTNKIGVNATTIDRTLMDQSQINKLNMANSYTKGMINVGELFESDLSTQEKIDYNGFTFFQEFNQNEYAEYAPRIAAKKSVVNKWNALDAEGKMVWSDKADAHKKEATVRNDGKQTAFLSFLDVQA